MTAYVLVVVFMITLVVFTELVIEPWLERIAKGNPFNGMLAVVLAFVPAGLCTLIMSLTLPLFLILKNM